MFETFCSKRERKEEKRDKRRKEKKRKRRRFLGGVSMRKTATQRADEREARESCERPVQKNQPIHL